jgi:hypothetical protein
MTQEDCNKLHHQKRCNADVSTVKATFNISQELNTTQLPNSTVAEAQGSPQMAKTTNGHNSKPVPSTHSNKFNLHIIVPAEAYYSKHFS